MSTMMGGDRLEISFVFHFGQDRCFVFFSSRTFGAAALCQSHAEAADGLSSAERPGAGTGRRHGVLGGTWEVTNQ